MSTLAKSTAVEGNCGVLFELHTASEVYLETGDLDLDRREPEKN